MARRSTSYKASRRLAALASGDDGSRASGVGSKRDLPPTDQNNKADSEGGGGRASFQSAHTSSSLYSTALSRLASVHTHTTNASSKSTAGGAFYSAHSQLSTRSSASFHSAQASLGATTMLYGIDKEKQLREEDLILGTALAQQYLQDAEAAGSASPSHRSRRDTEGTTRTHGGHGGEVAEGHPQVPSLRHAASSDPGSEKRGLESEPPGSYRALSERLRDEEVEDDANEARHFVSARIRYPPPRYSVKTDAGVPAGAVLFLLGFLLLPLWWVGAVYPRSHDSDVARTWRKYNALMALLSLPLLGLILALGGWHAMHD